MKIFLQNHKPFEKHFKIKFKEPQIKIHSNGFISVALDWTSGKDSVDFWRFKYPELAHTQYGGAAFYKRKKYFIINASFEFPELEKDHEGQTNAIDFKELKITSWFEICLGTETEEEYHKNQYEYTFFEKTKYGLICWFAPKGWEDWNNAKDFEQ
jgi:hypothetical protein